MITAANVPETELLIIADMVCTQVQLAETIFGSILHGSFNEAFAQVFASMGFFNIQATSQGYRSIRELKSLVTSPAQPAMEPESSSRYHWGNGLLGSSDSSGSSHHIPSGVLP